MKLLLSFITIVSLSLLSGCGNIHFSNINDIYGDSDDDKILNIDDNCPNEPNDTQTDDDKDGQGNICDTIPATPLSTPESTWEMFRTGWRNGDVNLISEACGVNEDASERCREQFLQVKAAGGQEAVAASLGEIERLKEWGDIREYLMPSATVDGSAITVSFTLIPGIGWRMEGF